MDHAQLRDERRRNESQKPKCASARWRRFRASAWLDDYDGNGLTIVMLGAPARVCSLRRQIDHPLRGGKCARIHRAHLIRDARLLLTPAARGPYNRLSSRHVIGSGRT